MDLISVVRRMWGTDLGYGEPLMGFWPYFLQEYSSGGMSAIFVLIDGTRIVLFTRDFLLQIFYLKNDKIIWKKG